MEFIEAAKQKDKEAEKKLKALSDYCNGQFINLSYDLYGSVLPNSLEDFKAWRRPLLAERQRKYNARRKQKAMKELHRLQNE